MNNEYVKLGVTYGVIGAAIGHVAAKDWQKGALIGVAVGLVNAYYAESEAKQIKQKAEEQTLRAQMSV